MSFKVCFFAFLCELHSAGFTMIVFEGSFMVILVRDNAVKCIVLICPFYSEIDRKSIKSINPGASCKYVQCKNIAQIY